MALLGVGLEAPVAEDGSRRALSIDGAIEVILRPPTHTQPAQIRSMEGSLCGPDFGVSITRTDASGRPAGSLSSVWEAADG